MNDLHHLPDGSVEAAIERAKKECGGMNQLVGRIDASESTIRNWIKCNRVPAWRAKVIELELGVEVVKRSELNESFL